MKERKKTCLSLLKTKLLLNQNKPVIFSLISLNSWKNSNTFMLVQSTSYFFLTFSIKYIFLLLSVVFSIQKDLSFPILITSLLHVLFFSLNPFSLLVFFRLYITASEEFYFSILSSNCVSAFSFIYSVLFHCNFLLFLFNR